MIAAVLGWTGTVGTITAYVMLMRGRVRTESVSYALMNMMGGFLATGATVMYGAWSSAASNFIWGLVALHGLVRTLRARSDWRDVVELMPYVTPVEDETPEPETAAAAYDDEELAMTMELPVQAA